jgi:hypothetical protein
MATSTGKAARRKWGTKANAKRARKRKHKNFGTPESEKAEYRRRKAKRVTA